MGVKTTSSNSYQSYRFFIAHSPKQVLRTSIDGTSDVEVKKMKQFGIPGGQWRLFWFLLTLTTLWAANEDTDCLQGTKDIDLNILPPSYGYRLVGDTLADTNSVSSTGDVNGDGINDVLVGSHTGDPDLNRQNAGITYVLFGKNASFGPRNNLDMNSLNPATGFRILGKEAGDQSGFAVASGDLNGDYISDIIIGARYATVATKLKVGIVYVLYGSAVVRSASTNDVDLALFSTSAGTGFRIMGKSQDDNVGSALATGDVNNDGKTDIIVGAPTSGSANVGRASAGRTVVVYGHTGPTVDVDLSISLVTSSAGYRIYGYVPSGVSGSALCVCDVNGDHINDVIIGAPDASTEVRNVAGGVVYVVYGTAHAADVDLQTLNGNSHRGYRIVGAVLNDRAGTSVACGDVNGNGMPDVIIGATGADPLQRSNSGAVYVVYGHNTTSSSVNTTDKDLFSMGTSNAFGYQIYGTINGDATGVSVASGDVNADGIEDVLIGATSVFPSSLRAYSGMVYVVYGHDYNTYDTADVDLAQLVSGDTTGYRISGIFANNNFGTAVSVGDVNNDGIADIVAGANQPTAYTGLASIVYGYNRSAVCVANSSADIDLKYLTTDTGYTIVGKIDRTGQSVCTGDVNGDGISDIITGAVTAELGGSATGAVYVIFGRTFRTNTNVSPVTIGVGITIHGDRDGDNTGNSVGTGDVNNDGISDIILAAYFAGVVSGGSSRAAAGVVYVVFGKANLQDIYLGSWDNYGGFKIFGAVAGDQAGIAVAGADVNGDGICDVIVTASLADPLGRSNAGSVYVVYGINSSTMGSVPYSDVDLLTFHTGSSAGFRIIGANMVDSAGVHVASGDINGDGIYDIIIGASAANVVNRGKPGVVYVIYGKHNHTNIDLLHINNSIGFRVLGVSNDDRTGISVGSGDVNGDGVHDLILSAFWADPDVTRINAGTVYVLFGHNSSHDTSYITDYGMYHSTHNTTDIDLSDFNTSDVTGFRIFGGAYNDNIGIRISSGDVNDDGYSDVIIGSIGASSLHSVDNGITYVVYGSASVADIDLQYTLPRTTGYRILGVAVDDQSGYSVSTGDINNDGVCDVITSAPLAHVGTKLNVGAAYVVYGVSIYGDPTSQPSTKPSSQPSMQPSTQPTVQPSAQPAAQPSAQPSTQPTLQPSTQPSTQPTTQPSRLPTVQPSARPSSQPSTQPSTQPSSQPSMQPSAQPTALPTVQPSYQPTTQPSSAPSTQPSTQPSVQPTSQPSNQPTQLPSSHPSAQPTGQPTSQPSNQPTIQPSGQPSRSPTSQPVSQPTSQPTMQPSRQPSRQPTSQPTKQPSSVPTLITVRDEWVWLANDASAVGALAVRDSVLWVCGSNNSSSSSGSVCYLVDGRGDTSAEFVFVWDRITSLAHTSGGNVMASANSADASSVIAKCVQSVQLVCSVRTYARSYYVRAVYSQYTNKMLYVGVANARTAATIVSTGTTATSVTYYYDTADMSSTMTLLCTASPPHFVGSMVAGIGTLYNRQCILAGWINLDTGIMSAYYLLVLISNMQNSAKLVNNMVVEPSSADSIVVGGISIDNSVGMRVYIVRTNSLYRTVLYAVRYLVSTSRRRLRGFSSLSSGVSSTVGKDLVIVGEFVYVIADYAPSSSNITRLCVLKVHGESGYALDHAVIYAQYTSITCNRIVLSAAGTLHIACTVYETSARAVVLTVTQALAFTQLPAGFLKSTTSMVFASNLPVVVIGVAVTKQVAPMVTTDSTYVTGNQAPSFRPSVQPTLRPTIRPSLVPSTQPTSTPTASPCVSPQPSSHPSSTTPTNTKKPTVVPTARPTRAPTVSPTRRPTAVPSNIPSVHPTLPPTLAPTVRPTALPTPLVLSSRQPTRTPTLRPTRTQPTTPTAPTPAPTPAVDANNIGLPSYVVGASVGAGLVILLVGYMIYRYNKYINDGIDRQKRFKEYMKQQTALVEASRLEREKFIERERQQLIERKQRRAERDAERVARVSHVRTAGRSVDIGVYDGVVGSIDVQEEGPVRHVSTDIKSSAVSNSESGINGECSVELSSLHSSELSSAPGMEHSETEEDDLSAIMNTSSDFDHDDDESVYASYY